MAKFEFYVSTGYVGEQRTEIVEIDDEDFEGLNEQETEELISEVFETWVWENISASWSEIKDWNPINEFFYQVN